MGHKLFNLLKYALAFFGCGLFGGVYLFGENALTTKKILIDLGDPMLGLWIYERIFQNLLEPWQFLDGKIFYPNANTLVFSELMLIPALCYSLVRILISEKVLAYHVTLLCFFSFNFLAMWRFSREFLNRSASFIAALVFSFGAIRIAQLGHVQLIPQFFFPLACLAGLRYFRTQEKKYGYFAALFIAAQFYCCVNIGFFLVLSILPVVCVGLYYSESRSTLIRHLLVSSAIFVLAVLPIGLPYLLAQSEHNIPRSIGAVRMFEASVLSYITAAPTNFYGEFTSKLKSNLFPHEKYLFMGFVVLFLSVLGLIYSRKWGKFPRRTLLFTLVFVFMMSLGPSGQLYALFYYVVPGLNAIRVPARFGFSYLFIVAILSGVSIHYLTKVRHRLWLPILAGVLILFESYHTVPFVTVPRYLDSGSMFLERQELKEAVLHLPLNTEYRLDIPIEGEQQVMRETLRMYQSLFHHHPILNGYGSFRPEPLNSLFQKERQLGPSEAFLAEIRKLGVRYLLIERNFKNDFDRDTWNQLKISKPIYSDEKVDIYRLPKVNSGSVFVP